VTAPSTLAEGAPSLADISAQLAKSPLLRADFLQERKLRVLTRSLASQGRLLFVSGQGVLWQVTAPQPAALVIKPGEVIDFTDGKARPLAIGESPVFHTLVQVFLAALSGDLEGLAETFELAPARSEQGWHLALTPKASDLAALITSIELGGNQFVEEILIAEASGDSTLIRISDFRTEPVALDDQEKAYFAD
jgi:hypothetical protein